MIICKSGLRVSDRAATDAGFGETAGVGYAEPAMKRMDIYTTGGTGSEVHGTGNTAKCGRRNLRPAVLIAMVIAAGFGAVTAQSSSAGWDRIDNREIPEWFADAKFGIFIHWGVYSVPAWTPSGTYSEWYQYWLQTESLFGNGRFTGREVADFHRQTFGEGASYFDLAPAFKAELYDPREWADLFRRAGVRYAVMTSKHHDGFAMWPSREASTNWGFPWNAAEIGPRRDLVGEYMEAMRAAGIKTGLYYSLYEWFHPWYKSDFPRFVEQHFLPQFKDLIQRYRPEIVWADGEWEHPSADWRSLEALNWLLDESAAPPGVLINDRWGKETRHRHGSFFTTEYETEGVAQSRPWEECRGMALSFGFNRDEDADDYVSPKVLLLMLVDIVSRGGNLLLDIGPSADGKIPVIMQERLLQMGKWLERNGEAIYGTRPWVRPVQWGGEGEPHQFVRTETLRYIPGNYILKQTVDAEPGHSFKEVFFTAKGDSVFAILPEWPGETVRIRDFDGTGELKVRLLGFEEDLYWRRDGADVLIRMPAFSPEIASPEDIYVLELTP